MRGRQFDSGRAATVDLLPGLRDESRYAFLSLVGINLSDQSVRQSHRVIDGVFPIPFVQTGVAHNAL